MSEKNHKIEVRHNMWHVTLSHGDYSDYTETHLFFSGNSSEEVWHHLKQFADEGGLNEGYMRAFKYEGEIYQYKETALEIKYYDIEDVEIEPLELIFVNPK